MRSAIVIFIVGVSTLYAQYSDSLFYGNSRKVPRNPFGWGYIAGTNGYGDIGKYQRFDIQEEIHIVGARMWMGLKRVVNTPDSIAIVFKRTGYGKEYYDSLSGGPGNTFAALTTTLAAFDTGAAGTAFFLSKPVNISGGPFAPESVFVGIEWQTAADDTFSLVVDSAGQGNKAYRAWEQLTGVSYKYQRFDEPSDFSWLLDGDIWIALLYNKGLLAVRDNNAPAPERFFLEQNYPNPFNPSTTIGFSVLHAGRVTLTVYDLLGKETARLVDQQLEPGRYTASWSAAGLPSGIYFYRLRYGSVVETKKMILLK